VSTRTSVNMPHRTLFLMSQSRALRKYLGGPYLRMNIWLWKHLPAGLATWHPVRAFGVQLHNLIQMRARRQQAVGTYFFRNRPELDLLLRLLEKRGRGSTVDLAVLGCSKGAEVYSISYAIRAARPDLNINLHALDISKVVLEFAAAGVYSLKSPPDSTVPSLGPPASGQDVAANTFKDQPSSIFERMSSAEMEEMFDCEGDEARVKPRFREGITWQLGDAGDPALLETLGLQDIVVANRFLCHMHPQEAERCMFNLARLVKPGGHLFVSGVDLDVRSRVLQQLGWTPVTELINEIHEGDISLRRDWPLEYWGLEPIDEGRIDWKMRYASVFQHDR
jgi:chemotaxis methyl-accepting protein methylase